MSLANDDRTITILRMVADGKLGSDRTGTFAKFDDIAYEIGNKHDTKSIIDYLVKLGYIRNINARFEKLNNSKLDYKAYQITELGRTKLSKNSGAQPYNLNQNNFGNITGANISINSQYVSQVIEKQDQETKELLSQLLLATERKDKSAILKTLGFIGDKSIDLLIAIIAGGVKL